MIDLYTAGTPNGHKASIMLEEIGLPYQVFPINISMDEQFQPDFVEISPWSKIPAIVDHDPAEGDGPFNVFESGAILMYLAEKTGMFLPQDLLARYDVIKWLMFQIGGIGPMFGQFGHFVMFAKEDVPYAKRRYRGEAERIMDVIEDRLAVSQYLASDDYSIADIASYAWVKGAAGAMEMEEYSNISRWLKKIGDRPAVQKGMDVP
jgi:GST-like protein